ncbi:MAG: phosphotransferase [Steroidobacteraceae bacterium]
MPDAPLPRSVEALTPDWLTRVLQRHCPGIRVASLTVDKIIWGTATKVLVDVRYEASESFAIPNKLCIKGEFDERLRNTLGISMTGTQMEAAFYADMGPKLGVPLARHWFAGSEPGMGVLILDNMAAANFTFGAPTEPWSPELVSKALDILAILHASTWGKTFPEVDWMQVGSPAHRGYTEFLMSQKHWQERAADVEAHRLIPYVADRERSLAGWRALWRYDAAHSQCFVHGDAHLGNTCIDPSGQPFFIDWGAPCISNWAIDVAYFITGALTVENRRTHEDALLRHYLDRLASNGGPRLDLTEAWADYRRHLIQGMNWGVLPPTMQARENVAAMGERYGVAMMDHDTLGALGV